MHSPVTQDTLDRIRAMHASGATDGTIASATRLSRGCVARKRREMGLDAHSPYFVPTAEQIAELRVTSDRAMERLHGVKAGVWARMRRQHGIATFRPATRDSEGNPTPWKVVVPKLREPGSFASPIWRAPTPPRDYSAAGEAAQFLRRERFPNVYNRAKVHGKPGWQCGREVLSAGELIEKAERLGFKREGWMA